LIINVPFFVNAFFKMVMPLVDPITRAKVKFNPQVFKDGLFSEQQMMQEWWGGEQDFEYKHGEYWKDLVTLCETRSKAWEKNWRAQGAKIGESEWSYKLHSSSPSEILSEKAGEKLKDTVVGDPSTQSATTPKETDDKPAPAEQEENGIVHGSADAQATSTATPVAAATTTGSTAGAAASNADAGAGGDASAE
jgi:hypothetical protein